MSNFYELSIMRAKDEVLVEYIVKENMTNLFTGICKVNEPLEVRISEGSVFYDILGFQDTANIAISQKLFRILSENNVTGWRGTKLRIKGRPDDYYLFQVIGKCGKLITPKTVGFYTGFKFDEYSWDSSDIFVPKESTLIFCTARVKDLITKNEITNISIADITKIEGFSTGSAT